MTRTRDGRTRVDNNGKVTIYDRNQPVIIDARGGNDRIQVRGNAGAEVYGGAGNDRIDAKRSRGFLAADGGDGDDRILGGRGRDLVLGGRGRDTLVGNGGDDQLEGGDGADAISGGRGHDVLYGGRGDDRIAGGQGRDYLSGEAGRDVLRGGAGDDAISGGRGIDRLSGDDGDDALIVGTDADAIVPGGGDDRVHRESTAIPENLQIKGSREYRERVRSDLETLAATPAGRKLLDELAARGHRIVIEPGDNFAETAREGSELNPDGTPGTGTKRSRIGYNIDAPDLGDGVGQIPSTVALYHELVHTYNYATGTTPRDSDTTRGTENAELIAVGLPIDHDGDPNTPEIQPNPYYENLFREQLNIPSRDRY